jgi:hypothetical protein
VPGSLTVTLNAVADSYVQQLQPDANFGTEQVVYVDAGLLNLLGTSRGLFKFDLAQVPPASAIQTATLRLCLPTSGQDGAGQTHELRRLMSSWTETGVTWNNQPPVSATTTSAQVVPVQAGCLLTDVSTDVQNWVNGANNYGWRLSDANEALLNAAVDYASREHPSPPHRPQLVVTYLPPVETTVHLHNSPSPPTGDTVSLPELPMDQTAPVATTLYNYDIEEDSAPGLFIQRGGSGPNESDPKRYQAWRTPAMSTPVTIAGPLDLTLWTATKDFEPDKGGSISIYLRDFNGSTHTTVAVTTYTLVDWQNGSPTWVMLNVQMGVGAYTIAAGHQLELKIIVNNSSEDDLWFAYDTETYDSHFHARSSP